jgi:hypothetical protein
MTEYDNEPKLDVPYVSGPTAELRAAVRDGTSIPARLAFGGLQPGLVGCEILDVSAGGVRVTTFRQLDPCPELFSIEFLGVYSRARRSWTKGNQIGLEFIKEDNQDPLAL